MSRDINQEVMDHQFAVAEAWRDYCEAVQKAAFARAHLRRLRHFGVADRVIAKQQALVDERENEVRIALTYHADLSARRL